MNIKKFFLSYYKNATINFYINKVQNPVDALEIHTHDYYQFYYVLKGTLYHHLENKVAQLVYGDVFILPPNTPHYISTENEESEFYFFSFMPDFFSNVQNQQFLFNDVLKTFSSLPKENIPLKLILDANDRLFFEVLLDRILFEFNQKNMGAEEIIHESVATLLTLISRNYFDEHIKELSISHQSNEQSVFYCINYITNHCEQDISLEEISKLATMSKSHFCKLFKSITNMTFKDFLNSKRIEKSTVLLSTSNVKILTVSQACGFKDFSSFSRNFKKLIGISPIKYRKMHRQ